MNRNTLLAGAGVLALVLAGGAYAAGEMGEGMHHHGHMGMGMKHGDPAEMADHLMGHFDLNKDGKITKDEILQAGKQETDEHFKMMDANHDGNVTADEAYQVHAAHMREHVDEMFKSMDKNGDGKVSKEEFAAAGPMMHHHGWMHGHEGMDNDNDD